MSYFGRTMRHYSLNKTVILGYVFGELRRGRPRQNGGVHGGGSPNS